MLLAATAALLLAIQPTNAAQELLANGGFEAGTSGWAVAGGSLSTTPEPHSGALAGLLTSKGQQRADAYQVVPVTPGGVYKARGWLKDSGGLKQSALAVIWLDATGSALAGPISAPDLTIGLPDWQFLTTSDIQAPAAAYYAKVNISLLPSSNEGAALLIDGVSFTGAEPLPSPTPTPEPPPPEPPPPEPPHPPPAIPTPTQTPTPTPLATASATPLPTPTPPAPAATPIPPPAEEPAIFSALVNGSFEDARADGSPYGWQKQGGSLTRTASIAAQGAYAAAFSSDTASTKWAHQAVMVLGDHAYEFGGLAYKNSPDLGMVYLRISWYESADGSGALLDSADSTEYLASDAPWFRPLSTGAVIAPATARSARLRLMAQAASGQAATAYFDALYFGETGRPPAPEGPGSGLPRAGSRPASGAANTADSTTPAGRPPDSTRAESPAAGVAALVNDRGPTAPGEADNGNPGINAGHFMILATGVTTALGLTGSGYWLRRWIRKRQIVRG